jgi:enoyl-CoA hydratase
LTDFVKIEKGLGPEGRIAVVRFDRGDNINALSPEALRELTNAAHSFGDDSDTSVVVLTGGPKHALDDLASHMDVPVGIGEF